MSYFLPSTIGFPHFQDIELQGKSMLRVGVKEQNFNKLSSKDLMGFY